MVDRGRRVEGGEAVNHMRREGQWATRAGCEGCRQTQRGEGSEEDVTKREREARDGQRENET